MPDPLKFERHYRHLLWVSLPTDADLTGATVDFALTPHGGTVTWKAHSANSGTLEQGTVPDADDNLVPGWWASILLSSPVSTDVAFPSVELPIGVDHAVRWRLADSPELVGRHVGAVRIT